MMVNKVKKPTSNRRGFLRQMAMVSGAILVGANKSFSEEFLNKDKSSLKILTCNIRVDLPVDEQVGKGWGARKQACLHIIKKQKADVIGFQEVLANQFEDLKDGLSDYVGLGFHGPEMDQFNEGYHGIAKNPIFFSKKRFELITAGGYWLSENPLIGGSISWESARARNCFWVRLRDKNTGKHIRVVNLHLDHVKDEAKLRQIELVLQESAQYPNDFIQIMTGDFNSGPDSLVINAIQKNGWNDSFISKGKIEGTTHSFKPYDKSVIARSKKIDFIFTKGPIKSLESSIIKDNYKGIFPSDHYFVEATLFI